MKELSKQLARAPAVRDGLTVKHPFLTSLYYEGADITQDSKAFDRAVAEVEKKIDAAENAKEVMYLVSPIYREKWLGMVRSKLSKGEYSRLAGEIGIKDPESLKETDKRRLMTKVEYDVYKSLPKFVKLKYKNGWHRDKHGKKVPKEKILCYYNRRGEDEYIIDFLTDELR